MSKFKEIILNEKNYLKNLLLDINQASHSIDLEVFIFENDSVGKQIADALCIAANKGIKVRVLVDGVGSINWGNKLTQQMEKAGIQTRVFHPLPWKFMHWQQVNYLSYFFIKKIFYLLSKLNYRNHRKVCIIDQTILYAGSANISEHLLTSLNDPWKETVVKLKNINFNDVQYAFNKAWGEKKLKNRTNSTCIKKPIFHLNYSWYLRFRYYKQLTKRISMCKKRIWVTNSYFLPNGYLAKKIIKAKRKGVDVKILLPSKSDVFIFSIISSTIYESLLRNGVIIYEYLPRFLHAKTLILDDWITVGSNNFNYRSFFHDLEINVEISNNNTKKTIEQQFLNDIHQAKQVQLSDLKKQSIYKKILGRILLIFRYWL